MLIFSFCKVLITIKYNKAFVHDNYLLVINHTVVFIEAEIAKQLKISLSYVYITRNFCGWRWRCGCGCIFCVYITRCVCGRNCGRNCRGFATESAAPSVFTSPAISVADAVAVAENRIQKSLNFLSRYLWSKIFKKLKKLDFLTNLDEIWQFYRKTSIFLNFSSNEIF